MSARIVIPEARVSFPSVFAVSKAMADGTPGKYQCTFIFEKGADLSKVNNAVWEAVRGRWGESAPKGLRLPIRCMGERESDPEKMEGQYFITARTQYKVPVYMGPPENRVLCEDPDEIYGGCYATAVVTAFSYVGDTNKGVAFALNKLWKTRDGARLATDTGSGEFDEGSELL
jgi:hypothetical protein